MPILTTSLSSLVTLAAGLIAAALTTREEDRETDRLLIQAILDGDTAAYRGLVERYESRLYTAIFSMVRNQEDARDLTQDAFVKAYRNLIHFRLESSFYTWLYRIGMNVCIDHFRRRKLRRTEEWDDGIAAKDSDGTVAQSYRKMDPGKDLERKQLQLKIMAAMETLPDDQRQVVVLREIEGMSYKEIADVMEIPEGTVMSRLFYARKKLQAALKEHK